MRRDDVVTAAHGWIGTPYVHQASLKGAGTDCLGLVRGVWRELVGDEPEVMPPYTPDWAEALGKETLLEAARRWLVEVPVGDALPGDMLAFRMGLGVPAKHCAILSAPDLIVHAYWGRSVVETRLVAWWALRAVAAFRFPGIED